jgi:hypothetical protein
MVSSSVTFRSPSKVAVSITFEVERLEQADEKLSIATETQSHRETGAKKSGNLFAVSHRFSWWPSL